MPKHKTLIVFAVVIAFSFSLIGCGLLTLRSTGPDEVAGIGGDLPEWLLLAHRGAEGPGSERGNDPLEIADDENETDTVGALADGDSNQNDNATVPSTEQTTQPSTSQGNGTGDDSSSDDEEPAFGTKEHLIWLKKQQEKTPTMGDRERASAAEEAAKDDSGWWKNPTSGSSGGFFGN